MTDEDPNGDQAPIIPDVPADVTADTLPDDPAELKQLVLKEQTARRQITARAHEAEEKFKTLKGEVDKNNKPNKPSTETREVPEEDRISRLELAEEKRQFGHTHNLAPEEADRVFAFARGNNLKPEEALKDPFIQSGLEGFRAQNRTSSATPGPSNRSPVVEGKTFKEMSTEEKRKNFPKVMEALRKK